ncbi:MAG: hypothetical protein NTY64_15475 [Deltaproteobacteria bacterium]|nr:hypothetical protein [Deltaproteobacteria bacterium]
MTFDQPTQDEMVIHEAVVRLLEAEKIEGRKIRLIGLSAGHLGPPHLQLDLFDGSAEKRRRLAAAVDAIRARLGSKAIRRVAD